MALLSVNIVRAGNFLSKSHYYSLQPYFKVMCFKFTYTVFLKHVIINIWNIPCSNGNVCQSLFLQFFVTLPHASVFHKYHRGLWGKLDFQVNYLDDTIHSDIDNLSNPCYKGGKYIILRGWWCGIRHSNTAVIKICLIQAAFTEHKKKIAFSSLTLKQNEN